MKEGKEDRSNAITEWKKAEKEKLRIVRDLSERLVFERESYQLRERELLREISLLKEIHVPRVSPEKTVKKGKKSSDIYSDPYEAIARHDGSDSANSNL